MPASKHGLGRRELGLAVTAIPSIVVRPGMTVAEAEAARRPAVTFLPVEAEVPDEEPWQDADAAAEETVGPVIAEAEAPPQPSALLPAAQNILPGAPQPMARPVSAAAAPPLHQTEVPATDSLELLDWFDTPPVVPTSPATSLSPAGPRPELAAPVPDQATPYAGPRVELGFRDGTSAELDPAGEQAQALEELARTLTGF